MKNKGQQMKLNVWDLDQTIIDSSHRTPHFKVQEDGSLSPEDVKEYLRLNKAEFINKDKPIRFALDIMNSYSKESHITIILTSRVIKEVDLKWLERHQVKYQDILHRGMLEDHEILSTPASKLKLFLLSEYLKVNNCIPNILVDDDYNTLEVCAGLGFECIHPDRLKGQKTR